MNYLLKGKIHLSETSVFTLPFCRHQLCENKNCSGSAKLFWDGYVEYLIELPKSWKPQGNYFVQYFVQRDSFSDPLMKAKLKFLEFLSRKLNKFLRGYQTDQPMVFFYMILCTFLCDSLKEVVRLFLQMFTLKDTIKKAGTSLKLLNIETNNIYLHKPHESVQIRTAAKFIFSIT